MVLSWKWLDIWVCFLVAAFEAMSFIVVFQENMPFEKRSCKIEPWASDWGWRKRSTQKRLRGMCCAAHGDWIETRKDWSLLCLEECVMEPRGQTQQFQIIWGAQIRWKPNLVSYSFNPKSDPAMSKTPRGEGQCNPFNPHCLQHPHPM